MNQSLDIVIPVYNESECIQDFHNSLTRQMNDMDISYHLIFVNDGSSDNTQKKLEELAEIDSHVKVIELSRNFGHQAAITCGMAESQANLVITIDGDGEHPIEKIPEMLAFADKGYDLVLTQRQEAQSASWFKRVTSNGFYKIIGFLTSTPIVEGVGDYRLMNRTVIDTLNQMPEFHRFIRGMVAWAGYRSVVVPYIPAKRLGGRSKYSLKKMLRLAQDAIFSFSLAPIIASLIIGIIFLCLAIFIGIISFINPLFESPISSLLVFLILFCTGVIVTTSSLIGLYSGMTFQQVKWRPNYIIRSKINF